MSTHLVNKFIDYRLHYHNYNQTISQSLNKHNVHLSKRNVNGDNQGKQVPKSIYEWGEIGND